MRYDIPTETSMPASLRISRVGRVTKPEPNMRTFLLLLDQQDKLGDE
jgi:hypothetical protein